MSKIEWTNETWNPIIGCSKISEGCLNCYAERIARRLAMMARERAGTFASNVTVPPTKFDYYPAVEQWDGSVRFIPAALSKPLHWRKPRRIFVCSMGDLFHENVQNEWIEKVFAIMMAASRHTFQILTKRPGRMINQHECPPNVHLGVTVENGNHEDRIDDLLTIPAAVRFVSVEPMLGPVDLSGYLDRLDWVICGCESGPRRRETNVEWIRDLRDQCIEAEVPFFLKQMDVNGRLVKMPELDGQAWDQMP